MQRTGIAHTVLGFCPLADTSGIFGWCGCDAHRNRRWNVSMKRNKWLTTPGFLLLSLLNAGCGTDKADPKAEAPPSTKIESVDDRNVFEVARPEQFALVTADQRLAARQLRVTGTVAPDILRSVPVISLATGRVVEVKARLGDTVKKGQVLLRVQSADLSTAFSDYRKAVADEKLARTQFERAKDLYGKGAISMNDLQVAEAAGSKAKVDLENTAEKIRVLGGNVDQPAAIVDIRAPISGVITDQQITNAAGVAGLGSPNPFTISDLSSVWILCDVFENNLGDVHVGEKAEIRLNAYPDKAFSGTISNVGPVLDPNIRSAKVRIEVRNPGIMRPGMFVTAIFHGKAQEARATVPATAILHLHDQDWVYVPVDGKKFRRVQVVGGEMLPGGLQEVSKGLSAGQRVVANALEFQNTAESQ
jgi:membrane fusion protein, heavy metal efflux system